ncbi:MAG: hypothetical protein WA133_03370 [Syntrophales bacterium]
MNEHEFICQLCEGKQFHDPAKGHVPPGWAMKKINGEVILLCDVHANPCHWFGGPSPAIKELYKKKFGKEITYH